MLLADTRSDVAENTAQSYSQNTRHVVAANDTPWISNRQLSDAPFHNFFIAR